MSDPTTPTVTPEGLRQDADCLDRISRNSSILKQFAIQIRAAAAEIERLRAELAALGPDQPTDQDILAAVIAIRRAVKPGTEAQNIRTRLSTELEDRSPVGLWFRDYAPDYIWDLIDIAAQRGIDAELAAMRDPRPGETDIHTFAHEAHAASGGPTPALREAYRAYLQNEAATGWRPTSEAEPKPGDVIEVRTVETWRHVRYSPTDGGWERLTPYGSWGPSSLPPGEFRVKEEGT